MRGRSLFLVAAATLVVALVVVSVGMKRGGDWEEDGLTTLQQQPSTTLAAVSATTAIAKKQQQQKKQQASRAIMAKAATMAAKNTKKSHLAATVKHSASSSPPTTATEKKPTDLASFVAEKEAKHSSTGYLKKELKKFLNRQRSDENQALGVRTAALREWAEYKLDLDDAEKVARESGRYSHAVLKYARKAVRAKTKEQKWAKKAFSHLEKALKEEVKHPEWIPKAKKKMTLHEKYVAASDEIQSFNLDPFHDRRRKETPLEKAESELQERVDSGVATRSERRAEDELEKMHHYQRKKRMDTFMGEVIEKVRKQQFANKFESLMRSAEGHARTAHKYTRFSSRLVKRAKALTLLENRLLAKIQKAEKKGEGGAQSEGARVQKVERVVVQLVPPPKKMGKAGK